MQMAEQSWRWKHGTKLQARQKMELRGLIAVSLQNANIQNQVRHLGSRNGELLMTEAGGFMEGALA
ncbi:hypothetical protein D3C72_2159150 [compost metagenome]